MGGAVVCDDCETDKAVSFFDDGGFFWRRTLQGKRQELGFEGRFSTHIVNRRCDVHGNATCQTVKLLTIHLYIFNLDFQPPIRVGAIIPRDFMGNAETACLAFATNAGFTVRPRLCSAD